MGSAAVSYTCYLLSIPSSPVLLGMPIRAKIALSTSALLPERAYHGLIVIRHVRGDAFLLLVAFLATAVTVVGAGVRSRVFACVLVK